MSQAQVKVRRTRVKRDELRLRLLETTPAFYLYDRMPESATRERLRQHLLASSSEFNVYDTLGLLVAAFEPMLIQ
jgi:hypothetical protein